MNQNSVEVDVDVEALLRQRHAAGPAPVVREVTGGRRDIFDRLGYGLPTTS